MSGPGEKRKECCESIGGKLDGTDEVFYGWQERPVHSCHFLLTSSSEPITRLSALKLSLFGDVRASSLCGLYLDISSSRPTVATASTLLREIHARGSIPHCPEDGSRIPYAPGSFAPSLAGVILQEACPPKPCQDCYGTTFNHALGSIPSSCIDALSNGGNNDNYAASYIATYATSAMLSRWYSASALQLRRLTLDAASEHSAVPDAPTFTGNPIMNLPTFRWPCVLGSGGQTTADTREHAAPRQRMHR